LTRQEKDKRAARQSLGEEVQDYDIGIERVTLKQNLETVEGGGSGSGTISDDDQEAGEQN